ncbi:MAG: translation initiation factor IF-2 N-terminal domain-containing protein, partial [Atopobiaceae bacterium]|nr:translation initiation factor IF-2 N-terminal domain-containing protein [Atopobiaceae bacterium]
MAKTRVHELATEYGMTSKEMLGHLADMKIPAKSASSTLDAAYVSIVRKKLEPILKARADEIEAQKRAEAEAKAEAERKAAEKAEQERLDAERRREAERAAEEAR